MSIQVCETKAAFALCAKVVRNKTNRILKFFAKSTAS